MILRRFLRTPALAALLTPGMAAAALAQVPFEKQIRHWQVIGAGTSCAAINRPANEMNAAPYNSLYLLLNKAGRWTLHVNFWPKAFEENVLATLVIDVGPAGGVRQRATATSTYGVMVSDLGDALRAELAKAPKAPVSVAVAGVSPALYFDLSDLPAVFAALEECAKTLR